MVHLLTNHEFHLILFMLLFSNAQSSSSSREKKNFGPSSPSMFMALLRAASKSTINHGLTELPELMQWLNP